MAPILTPLSLIIYENSSIIMSALTLDLDGMMAEWRLRAFPEAVNSGCDVMRFDGIDLDAHLQTRMQAWYDNLIRTAPLEILAPVDIAARVEVEILSDGTGWFLLPDDVVRLSCLLLPGWSSPALIIPDGTLPGASLQLSGRQRSDHRTPVAVVTGRAVRVCSPAPTASPGSTVRPLSCHAVTDSPGIYRIDSLALSTIKPII